MESWSSQNDNCCDFLLDADSLNPDSMEHDEDSIGELIGFSNYVNIQKSEREEGTSSRQTGGSERAQSSEEQDPSHGVDPRTQKHQQEREPRGQHPQPIDNPPGQEGGRILDPHNQPLDSVPHAAPRPDPEEVVPRGVPRSDPQGNYMTRYAVQANREDTGQNLPRCQELVQGNFPDPRVERNQLQGQATQQGHYSGASTAAPTEQQVADTMATPKAEDMVKKYVKTGEYGFTVDVEAVIKQYLLERNGELPTSADEFHSQWQTMRGTKGIVKLEEDKKQLLEDKKQLNKEKVRLEEHYENEKRKRSRMEEHYENEKRKRMRMEEDYENEKRMMEQKYNTLSRKLKEVQEENMLRSH